MIRSLGWFFGLWLSAVPLLAQTSAVQVRVQRLGSLRYNDVNNWGWNGWGLQAEYNRAGANRLGWLTGAELGYTGWGSQALAKGGMQYQLTDARRWTSSVRVYAMPGVALFRPRPLFTYRIGTELTVAYTLTRRFGLLAAVGLAYSAAPAYERYARIHRYVDVPVALGVQWRRQR